MYTKVSMIVNDTFFSILSPYSNGATSARKNSGVRLSLQDITDIPEVVANMLGVTEAFGGVFVTFIFMLSVVLMITVVNKKALSKNMFLVIAFFVLVLATMATWITFWWLIMLCAILGLLGGIKIGDA